MTGSASQPPSVEASGLSRWFGNVVAVNDISFTLEPGITGLLGPNGAGKSTLLHLLVGFLEPSAGSVRVFGERPWRNPRVYRNIGLVHASESVYPFMTGEEFVRFNALLHRLPDADQRARRAIEMVGMSEAAGREVGGYSKGMRQRIRIAAALVHDPKLLLLDEPFSGADPGQRLHLMDLLRELAREGRTILFSSHILEEVERLADRVLVILAGRLAAAGDFREIRRLMTDRPHTIVLRTSDNRTLAAALMADETVLGVDIRGSDLFVRAADLRAFSHVLPRTALSHSVGLDEVRPIDESLESVFAYLVTR